MPYLVDGHPVPQERIRQEFMRIGRDARWQQITDQVERSRQMYAAAEHCAIDVILIEKAALSDPRPVDDAAIDQEIARQMQQQGCRAGFNGSEFRALAERNVRLDRFKQEMLSGAVLPTVEEMENFFNENREQFRRPLLYHASHIVKYVNHEQSEELAEAGIVAAEEELDRGTPFAEVAERHSDCGDKGGDIGWFPAGVMLEDFDAAISELQPGERSGIFDTELGFHIAFLHEIKPAGLAEFDEVRPRIEDVMAYQRRHEAYLRAVADLRSKAQITHVPEPSPAPV